jgi:rhodanese-related sulfurtransferase
MVKNKGHMRDLPERSNRWLLRSFAVVVLLSGLSACSEPPYNNVDNAQLQSMLEQNIPVYDVRRPEEWLQTGVVEGSQLLTFVDGNGRMMPDFLDRFTTEVGQHDPVILICRTGSRTSTLARYLVEQMGYTQVFNVRNGIKRWIRDDRPVKRISRP